MPGQKPAKAPAGTLLDLSVPAQAGELKRIRDAVREAAERCGGASDVVGDVVLAVDEACQNVIRHAYKGDPDGTIDLRIACREGELTIEVQDRAAPVDPATIRLRPLDELRPGGLGVHFIRATMDRVEYAVSAGGRGNLLRMVKRLA